MATAVRILPIGTLSCRRGLLARLRVDASFASKVMNSLSSWLERMHDARDPGPATSVAVRAGRQKVDLAVVALTDDFDEIAARLAQVCRDHAVRSGRSSYLFRALDDGWTPIGAIGHTPRRQRVVRGKGAVRKGPPIPVGTSARPLEASRPFERLALDSMLEAQRVQDRLIARLQDENRKLRTENDSLRVRVRQLTRRREVATTSEVTDKIDEA